MQIVKYYILEIKQKKLESKTYQNMSIWTKVKILIVPMTLVQMTNHQNK